MTSPKTGEWWIHNCGRIRFVVGTTSRGLIIVEENGMVGTANEWKKWHHEPRCDSFDWVEPTPEPVPVESPDDWVEITDPDHALRANGVDMVAFKQGDKWYPCKEFFGIICSKLEHCKFRCRRKDLPSVKRIPVRLWCSKSILGMHAHVGVFARRDFDANSMEIKHDGYKFYVEASE